MSQFRRFERPEVLSRGPVEPEVVSNDTAGGVLWHWWRDLDNARGDRAALRRCSDLIQVAFVPAFIRLVRDLQPLCETKPEYLLKRLAPVAGLVAHLRKDRVGAFPKQMAIGPSGDKPFVSPLRFQRLLQEPTPEELYPRLRRVLPMMNKEADLFGLADAVYYWNDTTRKRWAYDYFSALPASYQP